MCDENCKWDIHPKEHDVKQDICHDIQLFNRNLTYDDLVHFSNMFIYRLSFYNCNLDNQSVSILSKNQKVNELLLSCNYIGDEACFYLLKTRIRVLNLNRNQISINGLFYLSSHKWLHTLHLSDNNINDDGVRLLAKNKNIKRLILRDNNIRDNGAYYLSLNTKIESLYLLNNKITDIGASFFAKNRTLRHLELTENPITDMGCYYLSHNTTLLHLDLYGNDKISIIGANYFYNLFDIKLPYLYGRIEKRCHNNFMIMLRNLLEEYMIKNISGIILDYFCNNVSTVGWGL
jgi:hypothetical protein